MPADSSVHRLIPFAVREAFSEPEQLLTAYFRESAVGLCILDTDFRYLAVNPVLAEMNGVPAAAHLGKTCRQILGDFAVKVESHFLRILDTGEPLVGLEFSGSLLNRTEPGHWIENYFPIKDADGRVKQIGAVVLEVTEQKRLKQELEDIASNLELEKRRLQALRELDQSLSTRTPVPELLPVISRVMSKVIPHDRARVCLYDPKQNYLRVYTLSAASGKPLEPRTEIIPLEAPIPMEAFLEGATRISNREEMLHLPIPVVRDALESGMRSIASAALVTSNGPLGLLELGSSADAAFRIDDLALLKQASSTLAVWIEYTLTHEALEKEKERLRLLHEIDTTLASRHELAQFFPAIAACIGKVIPYDLAGTWLYDEKNRVMRTGAIDSRVGDIFQHGEAAPVSECVLGQAVLTGKPAALSHETLVAIPFSSAKTLLAGGIRSICSIPLIASKATLGTLGLGSRKDDAFSAEDVNLLNHVATSIALALESALTQQALHSEKERLQTLREIDAVLVAHLDLDLLLPAISECLRKAVPLNDMGIYIYDEASNVLRDYAPASTKGIVSPERTLPLETSLAGRAFVERKSKIFNFNELRNISYEVAPRAIQQGTRSVCYLPLITGKGPLGVLALPSEKDEAFKADSLDLLEPAASAIAHAVSNAVMHRDLQDKKERLQALREIDEALVSSVDLQDMLPVVSRCLHGILPHDHMVVCLYDEKVGGLRNYAATTDIKKRIIPSNGVLPLRDSLTGQTFIEGRSMAYDYADLVNIPFSVTKRALDAGIRSSCFVPMATAKGPLGVLTLSSHEDYAFRKSDLEFLEQVAAALAQAGQNTLAHQVLREEKKRLEVALNVSTALAANWNVRKAFPAISAYLRRVLRQEYASFELLDNKSGLLVMQALDFPLAKGFFPALEVQASDGPGGDSLRERRPLTFSLEQMQRSKSKITECLLAEGMQSLCCVPLIRPKGPLGVLCLASTRADAFSPDDVALVNQVAAQLAVALENHHASLEIEVLKDRLSAERKYLEGELRGEPNFEEIVGQSRPLKDTLRQVEIVASSDATVLISGDTGTGKELVARAIHRMSVRRERAFIKLNCAAIPTGLLESELFGHEKGAFTGAVAQKVGRMELADQGTLFLDEIGEIPLELQPKLLRVLQDHEFERLGGVRTIKVNLRLVAATNRDLNKRVASGDFRSDLFYRLSVFPIRMPSLRDRRDDIPALVRHFVKKYGRKMDRHIESIPAETMDALMRYPWPGNVRELENLIERSVILSEGASLRVPLSELLVGPEIDAGNNTLESAEREHIVRVLRETGGVISGPEGAAHKLGLKRTTLQSKMQRLGITRKSYVR
ncbi:MAG TPA: sigma 54-interacting transcriptional regulator [Candidatus Sulfotelmatobacter sp.]